ncbi:MAG: rhomboid family intramembrane serine protease [Terriglobia bacterium]|jgi:membrane associated rhomboid family serine protease|nr:rhomboid family intramembrane serine protease [Terriglobia bacterium]
MLIPIKHENMSARRWPIVTFALIAINVVVFLFTYGPIERQSKQFSQVRMRILTLAARHPDLDIPESVKPFVDHIREKYPDEFAKLKQPTLQVADDPDARLHQMHETAQSQEEMNSLAGEYETLNNNSILTKYGYVPAHPTAISYITANFLHGGWLHIIGNLWFLWLAGFVLEDTWGRWIYSAFYFIAGAVALQFFAWTNPGSTVPLVGASGAVAALMGAFLVRFPKMKIEMYWLITFKGVKFKAPAYTLLPLWLLMEVFYGALFGSGSTVAHWAHVGGFAFGAVAAMGLKFSGLEHLANQAIEEQVGWTADPAITTATEQMEHNQFDEAVATLQGFLATQPNSVEAHALLQQIYWRRQELPQYHEVTAKLCALHLKAREYDLAWQNYEDFLNSGGQNMPVATWLDLGRAAEERQEYERALSEYETLIAAHPKERQSLMAQIAAGKVCVQRLNRPQDALKFFEAAKASPIPHLDWEMNIEAGIRDAKKVMRAGSAVGGGAH